MWNTKSEPISNCGLCVIMTCHWTLISCSEHTPVVHAVPGGEISVPVPSTQFCCEPKPAPKIRLFFLKQGLSNRYLVQFSHSVVSDSATPWAAAHQASLSITNSRNLLKLMSVASVMPSNHLVLYRPLLLPPSIPASGSFPVSQFFTSGGQSTGVSASASVLPMNIQDWFPVRLTGWISLQSMGLSRVFCNTTVQRHQ